jgi:predicted transposase YdaD
MLGITLRETRVYREIKEEGREEGREEGEKSLVLRLLARRVGNYRNRCVNKLNLSRWNSWKI